MSPWGTGGSWLRFTTASAPGSNSAGLEYPHSRRARLGAAPYPDLSAAAVQARATETAKTVTVKTN